MRLNWIWNVENVIENIVVITHDLTHTHTVLTHVQSGVRRNGKMASPSTKGFGFNVIESLPWFFVLLFLPFL